jgi:L-aspartate oxidase
MQALPCSALPRTAPEWDETGITDSDEEVVVSHNWHELRQFMWDYVGIVRTTKRLERAKRRVEMLQQEIGEYYGQFRVTPDLLELRKLTAVAELIVNSALARKESRGLHYTLDWPEADISHPPQNTVLVQDNSKGSHIRGFSFRGSQCAPAAGQASPAWRDTHN